MNRTIVGLVVLAVACAAAPGRSAIVTLPTTMDQLVPAGVEVIVGALKFSEFTFGGDLQATDVSVKPLDLGLLFEFFLSTASMQNSQKSITIGYKVSAEAGIDLADLSFVGTGTDPGVTAMVTKTLIGRMETLEVFQKTPTVTTMTQTQQSVGLPDHPTELTISETMLVSTIATGAVRSASISSASNRFSAVPEPSTCVLLAVGIVIVGVGRLRHDFR